MKRIALLMIIIHIQIVLFGCASKLPRSVSLVPTYKYDLKITNMDNKTGKEQEINSILDAKKSTISTQVVYAGPTDAENSMNSAAHFLMNKAVKQQQLGHLVNAVATLERALRIEPRNALLWNRLAHVCYAQNRYGLVVELASKSNNFVSLTDNNLRKNNLLLINKARQASNTHTYLYLDEV